MFGSANTFVVVGGWVVFYVKVRYALGQLILVLFTTACCVPRPRPRKLRHLRLGARGAAVPAAASNSEREVRYK